VPQYWQYLEYNTRKSQILYPNIANLCIVFCQLTHINCHYLCRMNVSLNIKKLREAKRLTQNDIAERLGVDGSNYAKQEKRGNKLSIEQLEKISIALGADLQELIFGENNNSSKQVLQVQAKLKELEKRNEDLESDYNRLKDMFDIVLPLTKEAIEFLQLFKSLRNNTDDNEGGTDLTERQKIALNEVQKLLKERQAEKGKFLGLF